MKHLSSNHSPSPSKQSGIAVVSAMLLAAMVVTLASTMIFQQQKLINQIENHFSASQARWMADASIQWSRTILAEDAKAGSVDHLKEPWATQLPATPFEGGLINGYMTDQQGFCNLNNLARSGAGNLEESDFLKRLMSSIGGNPGNIDALVDWIDADFQITIPDGAEDSYYLTQPNPYRAANQPLSEIGNLTRVQGFTAENIARLSQYCVVLPEPTPVNINTAPEALLGLMLPGLGEYELEAIAAQRNVKPFETLEEFRKLVAEKKISVSEASFSVGSKYFLITSQTRFGNSTMHVKALLKRDGAGWPQILWKRYG